MLAQSSTPSPSLSNPLTQYHWSEKANLAAYRPPTVSPINNPSRTNCPYLEAGLKNWHDSTTWGGSIPSSNGQAVTIPANSKVLSLLAVLIPLLYLV